MVALGLAGTYSMTDARQAPGGRAIAATPEMVVDDGLTKAQAACDAAEAVQTRRR